MFTPAPCEQNTESAGWILPAMLGGVIGALIPMRRAKCSLAAQKA